MAAPATAAEARAALRRLLRAVDAHVTSVAGNPQWRDQVLADFRAPPPADGAAAAAGLQLARDYAALLENIAHHRVRRCISSGPRRPRATQQAEQQQKPEALEARRKALRVAARQRSAKRPAQPRPTGAPGPGQRPPPPRWSLPSQRPA
jgi:hypothetical protein